MAGMTIRVLERTPFDFSKLLASQASGEIALATDVDVSAAREITILVRTHSVTTVSGGKFTIVTRASAPTEEDPGLFFRDSSALDSKDLPTTSPALTRSVLPANVGSWITIFIVATQGSSGGANLLATYSIDISLKE